MRATLSALLLLSLAAPAAGQGREEDPYQSAVQARLAGDPERAVALLQPIVTREPNNTDAQVQFGLAQLALGNLDSAEVAFRAALAVAPAYDDARIGLARIAQRRGDRAGALRELQLVDPANQDAVALQKQLASAEVSTRWALDLDGSYSTLSNSQPDWTEAAAQLRYRPGDSTTFGGRIEYARRFERSDIYGEVFVEGSMAPGVHGYVSIGGSVDPDFRPDWQIGAGGSVRVHGGPNATVLTLDLRQSRFASGDVQNISPGIEQYLAGRFWLTGRWINLFDDYGQHSSGFLVRGDVQPVDPLRLFVGYSDAPDTDEGIVVDVRSVFGGISYDINPRTTLRLSVAHEDRATGYDRTQFGLGFGSRF